MTYARHSSVPQNSRAGWLLHGPIKPVVQSALCGIIIVTGTTSAAAQYDPPVVRYATNKQRDDIQSVFLTLANEWESESRKYSSVSRKTALPTFKKVLDLGEPVLPLILQRLVDSPEMAHWFPALRKISGTDPVPLEHRGNIPEMRRRWLEWGRLAGMI